jgi:hypothetical protein
MIALSTGHRATVVFHERKSFVEILAPLERGLEVGLADVLVELNIGPEAITWIHDQLDKDAIFARATAGSKRALSGGVEVVSKHLRESSPGRRHEIVDAYASHLNTLQDQLLHERLIRLMKRHRTLSDIHNFEEIVAEDSVRAFSYWIDEMTIEYERELRRYDRLSHSLGWLVITCSAVATVSALVWSVPYLVTPFAGVATILAATQTALQPARRSRRTQEFVDRFMLVRHELDALTTVRDITPLNALQWQRLEKAIALIEE